MIEYGYQIKDGMIVLHPEQSKAIIQMNEKYVETESIYRVIDWLNASGFVSPSGKNTWTRSTVRGYLSNSFYAGNERFPRILSDELIEQVNAILVPKSKRTAEGIEETKRRNENMIHHVICRHCDKPMETDHQLENMVCACGNHVECCFIKEAFNELACALREDETLIEIPQEMTVHSTRELNELDTEIEKRMDIENHSNYETIELIKQRAEVAYNLFPVSTKAMESMRLLSLFMMDYDNWKELYDRTVKRILVESKSLIYIELMNEQVFEINEQEDE